MTSNDFTTVREGIDPAHPTVFFDAIDRIEAKLEPDMLERKPDTVTFTTSEEKVYVVTGSGLKFDHNAVTLRRIDLFAEGEWVAEYGPEDEVPREDLELITQAAAIADVSVASLSEYVPAATDEEIERSFDAYR